MEEAEKTKKPNKSVRINRDKTQTHIFAQIAGTSFLVNGDRSQRRIPLKEEEEGRVKYLLSHGAHVVMKTVGLLPPWATECSNSIKEICTAFTTKLY
jgi:hypothetical protein